MSLEAEASWKAPARGKVRQGRRSGEEGEGLGEAQKVDLVGSGRIICT